ncbi:helix-turn-helix domain-containing protein [Pedobacter sp. HMF7647]|uniref:Helix-turn-helix domain-containing protein n=2 Tax=Hufsiella arboris TaxID=2695275 RepID=A0A7K1Y9Q6_9SPHI|nr:AraC family transcriptional regulator [Hufsiella arboris]MXV51323.1 helix-turn-helix domain-containing protein [Hufsiella arboris]
MLELTIKNMVCPRCITAVNNIFHELKLEPTSVELGTVRLADDKLAPEKLHEIKKILAEQGFELLDDSNQKLIGRIKTLVIEKIFHSQHLDLKTNWSDIISQALHHDYGSLSGLFSSVEGITLEQYIIRQKIERVKELLMYNELSLSEIYWKLGYSSVAHLSAQFKKITGDTPSHFKNQRSSASERKPIDSI